MGNRRMPITPNPQPNVGYGPWLSPPNFFLLGEKQGQIIWKKFLNFGPPCTETILK